MRPTIHIGELIFASGDAMKDVITFAFDLPKDNKVKFLSHGIFRDMDED